MADMGQRLLEKSSWKNSWIPGTNQPIELNFEFM
jgi:hypothetical protein